MNHSPRKRRARRVKPGNVSFVEATYTDTSHQARGLFRGGYYALLIISTLGLATLVMTYADYALPYVMIVAPAILGYRYWLNQNRNGLPILPIFLTQQGLVYALPLFAYRHEIPGNYEQVLITSALITGIFFTCVMSGWNFVINRGERTPSKFDLSLGKGQEAEVKCFTLASGLLVLAVLFHFGSRTGLIWNLLPPSLQGVFPILRTFASAAAMLGALLGGLVLGKVSEPGKKLLFWVLVLMICLFSMVDVLISAASSIVLASIVGMALGKGNPPWGLLAATLGIVGFLNQGKTDIRERYWVPGTLETQLNFENLPQFYLDWIETSNETIFGSKKKNSVAPEEGLSIFERINNLQNTLYVVDAIEHKNKAILAGETYALIPPLFIPRAFWPDKPFAHEGQAILNVHFGRQASKEDTEKVFIAWGLLPEAIGNFGVWGGPVLFGLLMGAALGWLERTSMRKRVMSVEGFILGGLLLITAGSYEMVASVLLTSTFQFLVAVTVAGSGLFILFKKEQEEEAKGPKPNQHYQ